jgi:hypothetical protein
MWPTTATTPAGGRCPPDAPSRPGSAPVGVTTHVTTHEVLRLLGLSFRTDASIDRVEAGCRLTWPCQDRQKQL